MKGEEHILVNFPIDTSLKKKAHSALGRKSLVPHQPIPETSHHLVEIVKFKFQNSKFIWAFCLTLMVIEQLPENKDDIHGHNLLCMEDVSTKNQCVGCAKNKW